MKIFRGYRRVFNAILLVGLSLTILLAAVVPAQALGQPVPNQGQG